MTRLRALLSISMAHPKFPNLQPFEVQGFVARRVGNRGYFFDRLRRIVVTI